jgi:hypothetical protein
MWLDLRMPDLSSLSREDLVALAERQAGVIERQAAQITVMAGQISSLVEQGEAQAGQLEKLKHLLSRNSANSSMPPSKDDDPGRSAPPLKPARGSGRAKGKQKGAPRAQLEWVQTPGTTVPLVPTGVCGCGADLTAACDLGVVDRYQEHEVPEVAVTVTEYRVHAARCRCGRMHTAPRPDGAGAGAAGYGPNLQALIVYLLVMHAIPVQRCAQVVEALTGARVSNGFVHAMLRRAAVALTEVDQAIRTLITMAFVLCADETPINAGAARPAPGRKQAKKYLLVACTHLYTHYLLGDRSLQTFKAFVFTALTPGAVVVHDRYCRPSRFSPGLPSPNSSGSGLWLMFYRECSVSV